MQKEICGHGRFIKCKEECDGGENVGMGGEMRKGSERDRKQHYRSDERKVNEKNQ